MSFQGAKQVFAKIKRGGGESPIHVCRGVWGMCLQENFNFRLSEITSGAFSDQYLTTKDI